MDLASTIAAHTADSDFLSLPEQTVKMTKRVILDSIGVALAATDTVECRMLMELARDWRGTPQSTVIGSTEAFPAPVAALINGTMIQALDYDDTHDPSGAHVASCVLAAALAAGEARSVSGRDLIVAVALGSDVVGRIGLACEDKIGWTSTSVYGCFGATVAAAKVLHLSQEQIRHALGIVLSQASGTTQTALDSPLSKHIQAGFAAKAGVLSAVMAEKGITGIANVFNGKYGFFNLYKSGRHDSARFGEDLGLRYEIDTLSFKPFPSCRGTHGAIEAVLSILAQHGSNINPSNINSVEITIPRVAYELVGGPFEPSDNPLIAAQFSVAYTVAATLLHGAFSLEQISTRAILDDRIAELMSRIAVVVSDGAAADAFVPARVVVRTQDHQSYEVTTEVLKGSPANPMSDEELMEKFIACAIGASPPMSIEHAKRIGAMVVTLDQLSDVAQFTSALALRGQKYGSAAE